MSRLELIVAGVAALILAALVLAEPDILKAPFQSGRTVVFTLGGMALAAVAYVVMAKRGVAPVVRVLVLGVPFVVATWLLLSPYFVDEVVDDQFATSIAAASGSSSTTVPAATGSTEAAGTAETGGSTAPPATSAAPPTSAPPTTPAAPVGPQLLGSGSFVGLAGHEGTGDAGFFELEDGSNVLRLERFDIENGPDLRLYVVPGADQVTPGDGSTYLGALRGNVGDQTYELPDDLALDPGDWTVLVWCEAFAVEFVAATVAVTAG